MLFKKLNRRLKEKIKQEKSEDTKNILPEEFRRVRELEKDEIIEDLKYTTTTIFSLVAKPDQFTNPDKKFIGSLEEMVSLTDETSISLDDVKSQIEGIKNGNKPNPEILNQTIKKIYELPEIGSILDTANALFDDENESLRLALIIYARANGIELNDEDIEKVRETLLDKENPDLGGLFDYALEEENVKRFLIRR